MLTHVIIMKNGDSLNGEVQNPEISIKTSYADLSFSIDKIVHIHFKNSPEFPNDEMMLKTTDLLKGEITTNEIIIKIEASGQIIKVGKDKIHTIIFLDSV